MRREARQVDGQVGRAVREREGQMKMEQKGRSGMRGRGVRGRWRETWGKGRRDWVNARWEEKDNVEGRGVVGKIEGMSQREGEGSGRGQ